MATVAFTKMHGIGNDYIYVNTMRYPLRNPEALSRQWSRRHTGIGSDGLVLIGPSKVADFSMRIFNADGSEALMCGNATRCIGKYLYEEGLTRKSSLTLETLSGIKHIYLNVARSRMVDSVTVDMDVPSGIHAVPLGDWYEGREGIAVSMGNPHLVVFVDDVEAVDLADVGARLERYPHFPDRVNVEIVQVLSVGCIRMRVWERGSGITQACGTGACAAAVAAAHSGRCGRSLSVVMDGGTLQIDWRLANGHVYMTGPATRVYDGNIDI